MVNIAFPAMAATFGVAAPAMRWVIVCYVLSYAFLSFAGGALGDRIGYRPVFVVGLAGSAVAYVIAAPAPTLGRLVIGRVVTGLARRPAPLRAPPGRAAVPRLRGELRDLAAGALLYRRPPRARPHGGRPHVHADTARDDARGAASRAPRRAAGRARHRGRRPPGGGAGARRPGHGRCDDAVRRE